MAVVGSAYVVVRAITTGVERDIRKSLSGMGGLGTTAGNSVGKSFTQAFKKSGKIDFSGFKAEAEAAREKFQSLIRTGNVLGPTVVGLLGGVGALAGGLVSLGSSLAAAIPQAATLAGVLASVGVAAIAARLALGGIGQAVAKLNKQAGGGEDDTNAKRRIKDAERNLKRVIERNEEALVAADKRVEKANDALKEAQLELNKALEAGQEEMQQLGFDAEDAALGEKKAALDLEKARENLLRVQDLPPNNRARREAELAFAEAELNLRKAKDRNADLAKEQERLAKTGVEGLDSVIAARQAVGEAEEQLAGAREERRKDRRDAARAEADAERELARAREDAKKGGGAGADPLAGLTDSQKEFAKFLAGLKPKIDELKEAIASELLPKLQTAITTVMDGAFETIKTGLAGVGSALGDAALEFANTVVNAENIKELEKFFGTAEYVIRGIGGIVSSVYDAMLSIITAADPYIREFVDFIEGKVGAFAAFLDTEEGKKKLDEVLKTAADIAKQLGTIFGQTFGGLGGIIKANVGPGTGGQFLLDYLEGAATKFNTFANSVEGQAFLKQFFLDLSKNAGSVLDFLGGLVGELLKLGAKPEIGVFFDKLGEALPIFGQIGGEIVKALPSFGQFIVDFGKLLAAIVDGDQITAFFNTLGGVIRFVTGIFENEFVKKIMDLLGPVIGTLSALGVIFDVIKFAILVIAGNILLGMAAWAGLKLIVGTLFNALKFLGSAFMNIARTVIPLVINGLRLLGAAFMANPIGFVIGLIALLVGAFITAYATSEDFRNKVNEVFGAVRDFIQGAIEKITEIVTGVFNWVKENWPTLLAVLTGPFGLLVKFIVDNWDEILAFLKGIPAKIATAISGLWNSITGALTTAYTNLQTKFTEIVNWVKGIPGRFTAALKGIWDFLGNGLSAAWQTAKNWWNDNVAGKGLTIGGFNVGPIKIPQVDLRIPRLAQGGIIPATPGGVLAQIAEGGRAERVEPLDPDGLSQRDKALIKMLTQENRGQGMTFNIYPSAGMDERELADMISRKISFMMRKGATA